MRVFANLTILCWLFALQGIAADPASVKLNIEGYKGEALIVLVHKETYEIHQFQRYDHEGTVELTGLAPGTYVMTAFPSAISGYDEICLTRQEITVAFGKSEAALLLPKDYCQVRVVADNEAATATQRPASLILRARRLEKGNVVPSVKWVAVLRRSGNSCEGSIGPLFPGTYLFTFLVNGISVTEQQIIVTKQDFIDGIVMKVKRTTN